MKSINRSPKILDIQKPNEEDRTARSIPTADRSPIADSVFLTSWDDVLSVCFARRRGCWFDTAGLSLHTYGRPCAV